MFVAIGENVQRWRHQRLIVRYWHQSARSCFTVATKKIDEGAGHVTTLVEEVRTALTELAEELNKS